MTETSEGLVFIDISMSVDGYIAGPNDGPENGLGDGGEALHEWVVKLSTWREQHGLSGGETNPDAEVLEESLVDTGASIVGRRMFDNAGEWGDEPPFDWPVFVLTHEKRPRLDKGSTTFIFVDGVEAALEGAREAAAGKNVAIGGGGSTARQFLQAGLVDELRLHVAPILLGGGVRLFDALHPGIAIEKTRVLDSPLVTHFTFSLSR
jgi:dihydrofolate reductase